MMLIWTVLFLSWFCCFQTIESKTVLCFTTNIYPDYLNTQQLFPSAPPHPKWPVDAEPRGGQGGLRCDRAVLITQNRIARPSWLGKNNGIGNVSILMGKRGVSLSSRGKRPLFDDGRGGLGWGGDEGGGAFRAIASPWQRRGWLTYCQ